MTNPTEQQTQNRVPVFLDLQAESDVETPVPPTYVYKRVEKGIRKRTRTDGKGKPVFEAQVWADSKATGKSFPRIQEARKWRNRQAGARDGGQQIVRGHPKLKLRDFIVDFWEPWLAEEVSMGNLRESTTIWYKFGARNISREIGYLKVADISKEVLRGMLSRRIDEGDSKAKLRQMRATVRSILSLAVERDVIVSDTSGFMVGRNAPKAVKDENQPSRAWSEFDAQRFIEFVRGDWLEALWVLLITTGLRRGEALGLTWEDIDLCSQTLTVRRSLCHVGRELRFQDPKTESSKRTIAVGPATIASLKLHRQNQTEGRLAAESWEDEMDLVFSGEGGRPIRPDYVTKRLKRLVKDAGLEWIRVHGLRHTMASLALQSGTDIATVSERLGHSDTNVTARIYLHGSMESDRLAASALDDVLHR